MKMSWMRRGLSLLLILLALCTVLCGCNQLDEVTGRNANASKDAASEEDLPQAGGGYASIEGIPDYAGKAWVELDGNQPRFTEEELTTTSFERYSELDSLGRCGETMACVGQDIMPTAERESISSVYPTGWEQEKYDTDLVEGGYIYNRCHLIGFQLTGENANKENLITGTRYLNIQGMLDFENMVADYVRETDNHVMYRVTPMFAGNNLLASGVRMEAYSVEDDGEGVCFHVFSYNVQPGITINYATGENWLNGDGDISLGDTPESESGENGGTETGEEPLAYVLNTYRKKIHLPTCSSVQDMNESNRKEVTQSKASLIKEGYTTCGICKP